MSRDEKLSHATGLYLEGIRDGKPREAQDRHGGSRYRQHSTGVPDGREGFIAFFTEFIERNPVRDIEIVRSIVDGQYVFCHVYQNLNNGAAQWVTADLFDTDENDRLIEHWDVIAEYQANTASGRSMVDGPRDVKDLELTDSNKAHVRGFADTVLVNGNIEALPRYISATQFHQHSPGLADGLAAYTDHLQKAKASGLATSYRKIHFLLGEGNFVVLYSHTRRADKDYAVFDLFRLENNRIVEHWDVEEAIGPPATWTNSGKF